MIMNYKDIAKDAACDMAFTFRDEIAIQYLKNQLCSPSDLYENPSIEEYFTENKQINYTSQQSCDLIQQLETWKETEAGLWRDADPQQAIKIQAAHTFANAILHYWIDIIEEIALDADTSELYDEIIKHKSESKKLEDLREKLFERIQTVIEEYDG